jgi:hypothetical protein
LLFAGIIFAVIMITIKNQGEEKIAVHDTAGIYKSKLKSDKQIKFEFTNDVDTSNVLAKGYVGVLYPPHTAINNTDNFVIYTKKSLSLSAKSSVDRLVANAIENRLFDSLYNLQLSSIDSVRSLARSVDVQNKIIGEGGRSQSASSGAAYAVGYASAFLIYITLFIYGTMVLRGVSEEKPTALQR